jgi:septal ring factor EnvC (AmiA/AmiB activator)
MMKRIPRNVLILAGALCLFLAGMQNAKGQSDALPVLDSASLEQQMEFLTERTRIYDNYRAIRDDIFLKMTRNSVDSLNREKLETARLNSELSERDQQISSLNGELDRTKEERDQAIRTKDSFVFLGIEIQKGLYNTIMWILVLGLIALGVVLFLMFKRSFAVTNQTRKELETIQEEYEEYRKSSREKYEKLVVSHHNEIMKLKRS